MEKRDIYFCEHCKNVVEVLYAGAPALVCCGEKMKKLDPKTEDATTEKHVPYIEEADGGVLVKVGQNTAHPMTDAHWINFIEVQTKDMVLRVELNPGDKPEAFFPVKKEDVIMAREYCNLHGLWKG
jgi:superoxide reductase